MATDANIVRGLPISLFLMSALGMTSSFNRNDYEFSKFDTPGDCVNEMLPSVAAAFVQFKAYTKYVCDQKQAVGAAEQCRREIGVAAAEWNAIIDAMEWKDVAEKPELKNWLHFMGLKKNDYRHWNKIKRNWKQAAADTAERLISQ